MSAGRRDRGFTLLHLMVTTAIAAYAFGLGLPAEMRAATVERGLAGTWGGLQALASAARAHYRTEGEWPTLAEARTLAGGAFPADHALGGSYELTPRLAGGDGWLAGGLSVGACGIEGADVRRALAARLGHHAWVDLDGGADCVRWEVPPYGEEAAHLGAGGGKLFADVGIAGGAVGHAPEPWTGGLRIEANTAAPGDTPDYRERAALRGNGDLAAAGPVAVGAGARFGTDRWPVKPNPYPPGAANRVVAGNLRLETLNDPLKGMLPGDLTRLVDLEIAMMYSSNFCLGPSGGTTPC